MRRKSGNVGSARAGSARSETPESTDSLEGSLGSYASNVGGDSEGMVGASTAGGSAVSSGTGAGGARPGSTGGSRTGKKTFVACSRCRRRHMKCDGTGPPCGKCRAANASCDYPEAEKKIVISMKYLSQLHGQIQRLKIENASLRNAQKRAEESSGVDARENAIGNETRGIGTGRNSANENGAGGNVTGENGRGGNNSREDETGTTEVIPQFLDKYGQLIHSRTGESIYIGSSSMTLFGLEINRLVSDGRRGNSPEGACTGTVLEREGNAYRIMLGKTHARPGIDVNFTLPSYSYAMLLVDSFISYNDGCFYFFNEGLVKEGLRRVYDEKSGEPFRPDYGRPESALSGESSSTLETIWFCKVLLIFAIGEMYLGTANDLDGNRGKRSRRNRSERSEGGSGRKRGKKNSGSAVDREPSHSTKSARASSHKSQCTRPAKLPGSGFFNQASEIFTGLFASGAIDNCAREGGIEVLLLYAFYLQVADCTVASYFYFGLALRASLILGLHVDAGKDTLNRYELEHRRRLWWTVYMYERMLASKAGLPLSITDDDISTALPDDFDMSSPPAGCANYVFPEAEFIRNCVRITQINTRILRKLYNRHPASNILPVVHGLVADLLRWKRALPAFLNCDYSRPTLHISRLVVNLMTEYFQGVNLAVRPLLFHFVMLNLKRTRAQDAQDNDAQHTQGQRSRFVDLSRYSSVILSLLNASFQASINTIRSLWALLPDNMVALFGYMDREYLFTSAVTLILFNSTFGVHATTLPHLDHALTIFTRMRNLGNHPATLRREQILTLLTLLDFHGEMRGLIRKHSDNRSAPTASVNAGVGGGFRFEAPTSPESATQPPDSLASEVHTPASESTAASASALRPPIFAAPASSGSASATAGFSSATSAPNGGPSSPGVPWEDRPIFSPSLLSSLAGIDDVPDLDSMVNGTAEDAALWKDVSSQAAWLNNEDFNQLARGQK